MNRTTTALLLIVIGFASVTTNGNVIGYDEIFALAEDRSEALRELIPGTEDYYVYHALHYQHIGDFSQARKMIDAGVKKYKHTARLRELENRQALLTYEKDPNRTISYIIRELRPHFGHQRKQLKPEVRLPTKLDPKSIDTNQLMSRELRRDSRNVDDFEAAAYDWLVRQKLTADQRRDLLKRLSRPDYPGIVEMIAADLKHKHSRGFGKMTVHRHLLIDQLEALLKLAPELIKNTDFINVYLSKLQPPAGSNWQQDDAETLAYLKRIEEFARRLPPVQNSLKANICYQRLKFEQRHGRYDRERFMEYIRYPRPVHYINPKYRDRREHVGHQVNLHARFQVLTTLPPIGMDEPLVRDYLMHFLKTEEDFKAYSDYIEHNYLKSCFAETKIVNGIGDQEQWYAMMGPEQVKRLRDRIDLQLLPTNPTVIGLDETVALDVAVKNIEDLIVKIYEINTEAYYRQHMREISTDIDLDGLVPNHQRTATYKQPPLRRHVERFTFPELKRAGVYVVELIGNGVSSRALIRKGQLRFAMRTGAAGHAFRVYDDEGKPVREATLWTGGREYTPNEAGEIVVPFAGQYRQQKLLLVRDGVATLWEWGQLPERYELNATIHVERETLVAGEMCEILVRPRLSVAGTAADIALLEEPVLTIRSTDIDGTEAEKQVAGFELFNEKESTYEFKVPQRLHQLTIVLSGKVANLNTGKKEDVASAFSATVNGIDTTEKIENLFLRHTAKGYFLELLGRNGEPLAGRPVRIKLKNHFVRDDVDVTLKTDLKGRITLGDLCDIDWISAYGPEDTSIRKTLVAGYVTMGSNYDVMPSETLLIPLADISLEDAASALSLLEIRGGHAARNVIGQATIRDRYIAIKGLAPGDYQLAFRRNPRNVTIRVGDPVGLDREAITRLNRPGLQIGGASIEDDALRIRLLAGTPDTRVHVAVTRYHHDIGHGLLAPLPSQAIPLWRGEEPESVYLSGRKLGDEYRYIMERRSGSVFPGNMLTRPSLLLNPWKLRTTTTGVDHARAGAAWQQTAAQRRRYSESRGAVMACEAPGTGLPGGFETVDFLPDTSVVLKNLKPDKDGILTIPVEDLGSGQQVHILAVNGSSGVYRELSLNEQKEKPRERRLVRYLDPASHFTQQKRVAVVRKGDAFSVSDILSAEFEVYDSLSRVHSLLTALNDNATFAEFSFLLTWPSLSDADKREKYSQYACHELNLFLMRKDPKFFKSIIRPYLANKMDKTFLDHWLLDSELNAYLEPWSYGRLNMAERVLLGQSVKGEREAAARHVKDLYDLIPPDIERFNREFRFALRSRGLEQAPGVEGLDSAIKMELARSSLAPAPSIAAGPADKMGRTFKSLRLEEATEEPADNGLRKRQLAKPEEMANEAMDMLVMDDEGGYADPFGDDKDLARDRAAREVVRQLYRKLGPADEWVENNYYDLPIEQQVAALVDANGFWKDYAAAADKEDFLSKHLAEATGNFAEMMLVLAALDLPFEAAEHKVTFTDGTMRLIPGNDVVVFHKQVSEAASVSERPVILVSQNFFAHNDRYRYENNERFDKFVTEAFEAGRVYGCQVVLTNPTSTRRKVDVLTQIPAGALPVLRGMTTRTRHMALEPYSTQTFEYFFYFPGAGEFEHYPVHVAQEDEVIGHADAFAFHVVREVTDIDEESWEHISQFATDDEVIAYLGSHNIDRLKLDLIAFRMRDRVTFKTTTNLLRKRHVYNHTLWAYGLHHKDRNTIREYLPHSPLANSCGRIIESPLLTLDPVIRHAYQHKEYWPLVNARVFKLGKDRKILNREFYGQYMSFLQNLRYRRTLTDDDLMSLVVYMLLQDRVGESLGFFGKVNPRKLAMQIPYDYMNAYLAFYRETPTEARKIAAKYKNYPVERWRNLFGAVLAQCDEIAGGEANSTVDEENRTETQTALASTEPQIELQIREKQLVIEHANLDRVTLNFYPMDIELLFSRQPFVQDVGDQFAMIRPNDTVVHALKRDAETTTIDIPAAYRDRDVMIEVVGAGIRKRAAHYPNALRVDLIENYGHVKVAHRDTGKALAKVYVKVYARMPGGRTEFFKDGYTDLRGRFDYASLNTGEISNVERFSVLVLSDQHGAVVKEATPPSM
jgi:hypothetical protein